MVLNLLDVLLFIGTIIHADSILFINGTTYTFSAFYFIFTNIITIVDAITM